MKKRECWESFGSAAKQESQHASVAPHCETIKRSSINRVALGGEQPWVGSMEEKMRRTFSSNI